MSHRDALSLWTGQVSTAMPHLYPCQARLLALASFGRVIARSYGPTNVAVALAQLLDQKEHTLRQ